MVTLLNLPAPNPDRQLVERQVRTCLDTQEREGKDIVGFAFVVWAADGSSTADLRVRSENGCNSIPSILVPDFVRNRLLAEQIEEWTINTIKGVHP